MSEDAYRRAGVALEAARRHTEGIARLVTGGVTGFAGVYPLPPMKDPLLVGCTDGVGTKVLLARARGRARHLLRSGGYIVLMRGLGLLLLAYALLFLRESGRLLA